MTTRVLILFGLLALAVPASAQAPASPPRVEFLPRVAFHLTAEQLFGVEEDKRLRWDTNFGGELDLVDYGAGRLTFFTNYQAILGVELRRFDPNQGNYILEGALSARLPHVEVAGVFYHQSRHLSDRPKEFPIDWNMFGARARSTFLLGAVHMDARADIRGVVQRSYVDYQWEFDGRVRGDRLLRPGVGVLFAGSVRHLGVDGTRERGGQTGARAEGGIRFEGSAGAIELFAAAERRIDPYPLDFGTASWISAGFRLLSR